MGYVTCDSTGHYKEDFVTRCCTCGKKVSVKLYGTLEEIKMEKLYVYSNTVCKKCADKYII